MLLYFRKCVHGCFYWVTPWWEEMKMPVLDIDSRRMDFAIVDPHLKLKGLVVWIFI